MLLFLGNSRKIIKTEITQNDKTVLAVLEIQNFSLKLD